MDNTQGQNKLHRDSIGYDLVLALHACKGVKGSGVGCVIFEL